MHYCCGRQKDTGMPCPYVVEWLGDEDDDEDVPASSRRRCVYRAIERGLLVVVVPLSTDGSRSALVRLPARVVEGKDSAVAFRTSAYRTVEPGVWSDVEIAMRSRRRRRAPCISCEDAPGPPGRVFELLIGDMWTAMRNKSMARGLEDDDERSERGISDADVYYVCEWIQECAREQLAREQVAKARKLFDESHLRG